VVAGPARQRWLPCGGSAGGPPLEIARGVMTKDTPPKFLNVPTDRPVLL
jgi:hypothetical protein